MIIFLISAAFALRLPQVQVVKEDEKQSVWLIQESRSAWSVAHICFQSEQAIPSLASLETLFSLKIIEKTEAFLLHGVELHQRVGQDEVCLQMGALKEELPWAIEQSMEIMQNTRWKRKEWKEVQELYRQEIQRESGKLASLHKLGEQVVWEEHYWLAWDWRFWKINRKYKNFQKSAKIKMVIVGDWTLEELERVLPSFSLQKKAAGRVKKSEKQLSPIPECALIQIDGFPQVAVSQRFSFPDLSATDLQYLSFILGYGTRSRLMTELRENKGLVYSLGAVVEGKNIVVRYSLPPESVKEAMSLVFAIISGLSSKPITEQEFLRAKGVMFQRYYQAIEDYQQIASIYTLSSQPDYWGKQMQKRLSYSYDFFQKEPQFTQHHNIITGLSSNREEIVNYCKQVKELSFSQLVELKSIKD